MNHLGLQYIQPTSAPLTYVSDTPLCKYCKTTDPSHFHKSNNTVCRDPKNRLAGITSKSKTNPLIKCSLCQTIKQKEAFDISVSGFPYDKCRDCRAGNIENPLLTSENKSIVYSLPLLAFRDNTYCVKSTCTVSIPTKNVEQIEQSKIDEFIRWNQLVNEANYSKETKQILAAVFIHHKINMFFKKHIIST